MQLTRVIPTLAALALGIGPGHGAISVVNTNGTTGFVQANPPLTRTWSFDAGATADMLIVAYSGELGGAAVGATIDITYAGSAMTRALGGIYTAIFYLDLATTPYTGGAANLVVDLSDYTSRSGLGIGVVSVNGALGAGESIALHTTASGGANAQSVTLNTTAADAFAVASFNTNNTSGTPVPAVSAPLTRIYASNNIGSARGGAGYQADVAAGDHAYTWTLPTTNPTPRSAVAASFVVVPEPSAAALLGLGVLFLLRHRR